MKCAEIHILIVLQNPCHYTSCFLYTVSLHLFCLLCSSFVIFIFIFFASDLVYLQMHIHSSLQKCSLPPKSGRQESFKGLFFICHSFPPSNLHASSPRPGLYFFFFLLCIRGLCTCFSQCIFGMVRLSNHKSNSDTEH